SLQSMKDTNNNPLEDVDTSKPPVLEVLVLLKNTKELESSRCRLTEENAALHDLLSTLTREKCAVQAELEETKYDASCTLGELAKADRELEAQRTAVAKLTVELEEARRSVAEQDTTIAHLTALLDAERKSKEAELARLEAALTTERQIVQRSRALEKENATQASQYQKDLKAARVSIAQLGKEKSTLDGALASEKETVKRLRAREKEHIAQAAQRLADLTTAQSSVTQLQTEKSTLDSALVKEKQTIKRLRIREISYEADLLTARLLSSQLGKDVKTKEKRYTRLQRRRRTNRTPNSLVLLRRCSLNVLATSQAICNLV
ncbi:hypothetical protein MPER_03268, partial [Moniliophthora perniciosa FA553]